MHETGIPASTPRADGSALLTIDVQRDFSLPSSPAHVPGTMEAAPHMRAVAEAFRAAGRPIVHVLRLYLPDGSNAERSRRVDLEEGNSLVCPGTPGAELIDELKPNESVELNATALLDDELQRVAPSEWFMYEPRWGAFFATPLEQHLRRLAVDTVVVCGCNFPNCPRATIYEASERDFEIVFVPDATSGVYARGLSELESIGVSTLRTSECVAWLREAAT